MGLGDSIYFLRWALGAWLAFVIGVVLIKMASGRILLDGLLRIERKAPFGFDRIQLVFVTLLFAAGYIFIAFGKGPNDNLPNIPTPLLLILIGSNGAYLAVQYDLLTSAAKRGK